MFNSKTQRFQNIAAVLSMTLPYLLGPVLWIYAKQAYVTVLAIWALFLLVVFWRD